MERRQAKRYPLSAPARYRWNSPSREGTGTTKDVSVSGAFVLSQVHPEGGAQIELEISLTNLDDNGPGIRLRGTGNVLRIARETEAGFATAIRFDDEAPGCVPG